MTVFQIIGILVFAGCFWALASQNGYVDKEGKFQLSLFDRIIPYPEAARWVLYVLAGLILLAGMGLHSGDCYTDWDGRSNSSVCD